MLAVADMLGRKHRLLLLCDAADWDTLLEDGELEVNPSVCLNQYPHSGVFKCRFWLGENSSKPQDLVEASVDTLVHMAEREFKDCMNRGSRSLDDLVSNGTELLGSWECYFVEGKESGMMLKLDESGENKFPKRLHDAGIENGILHVEFR